MTRRSPGQAERLRDPERARRLLLDAAAEEFGAKGFAGARVRDIAARAGLNVQLISYYFGGKSGLYDELQREWSANRQGVQESDQSLAEVVTGYFRATASHPDWARVLVWQGLAGEAPPAGQSDLLQGMTAELTRRRQTGELAADLDPRYAAIVLFAAAAAPAVLPHVAAEITGLDPQCPEFAEAYAENLANLVRHLADRAGTEPGGD